MISTSVKELNLLQEAVEKGIIDITKVNREMQMIKEKEILAAHPHKIWQGTNGLYSNSMIKVSGDQIEFKDSVFNLAERRSEINRKIKLIEDVARICSKDLSAYILECVFFGKSYELLQPPCGRRQFYEKYREFFWMLDKAFS